MKKWQNTLYREMIILSKMLYFFAFNEVKKQVRNKISENIPFQPAIEMLIKSHATSSQRTSGAFIICSNNWSVLKPSIEEFEQELGPSQSFFQLQHDKALKLWK